MIDEVICTHSTHYLVDKLRFPEGTKFNDEKVIVGGHSFGGITAIRASIKN